MFTVPHLRCGATPSADGGEEALFSCRICFEDAKPSQLISPCKCKGTLKYVHQSCLNKWQTNVQKLGGKRDERATICGVCRTRYTVLPPKAALHAWRKVWSGTKGLAGAICISLLALCLSGPPCLHLALLVLLLLGSRSQSLLAVLLLLLGGLMATLYARGLRLVVKAEGEPLRFGLALIRHGAPVEGLAAGSLLVAHQTSLDGTMFSQAVVLITEKNSRGAKGVMLTQPMESVDSQLWSHQLAHQLPRSNPIRHFLGGPLGLPSQTGPASQTVMLHHVAAVPGAVTLIGAAAPATPAGTAGAAGSAAQQQQLQQQQPGRLPVWQQLLGRCAPSSRLQQQQQQQDQQLQAHVPSETAAQADNPNMLTGSTTSSSGATGSAAGSVVSDLGLYQGGSIDVLLQAILQASNAAAAGTAPPVRTSFASKLRWQLQHRGPGNRQSSQQQHQQAAGGSSSSSGAASATPSTSGSPQQEQLSARELAVLRSAVRMYHGVCAWSAGQLEGEVRAGAWGVAQAELSDIIITPPQLLWEKLLHSNRSRWF